MFLVDKKRVEKAGKNLNKTIERLMEVSQDRLGEVYDHKLREKSKSSPGKYMAM